MAGLALFDGFLCYCVHWSTAGLTTKVPRGLLCVISFISTWSYFIHTVWRFTLLFGWVYFCLFLCVFLNPNEIKDI